MTDAVSPFYQAVARALEWRIVELGLTMHQVDDASGLQDGHCAKLLHPDTPTGRQASWPSLDLLVGALSRAGYEVLILQKEPSQRLVSASRHASYGKQISTAASIVLRRNLRHQIATEFARYGGFARAKRLSPEERRESAV